MSQFHVVSSEIRFGFATFLYVAITLCICLPNPATATHKNESRNSRYSGSVATTASALSTHPASFYSRETRRESQNDFSKAKQLFNSGKYDECLKYVTAAIDSGSYGEHWHVLKIETELTLGQYKEAYRSVTTGIGEYDTSIQIRWVGIQAARFNNETRGADKLLDEIAENSSRSWRYRDTTNQLVLAAFDLNRGVDPKNVLSQRLKSAGNNGAVQLAIGELGFQKNDYQLAAEHFQKAAQLLPENPDAQFGIAKAFARIVQRIKEGPEKFAIDVANAVCSALGDDVKLFFHSSSLSPLISCFPFADFLCLSRCVCVVH